MVPVYAPVSQQYLYEIRRKPALYISAHVYTIFAGEFPCCTKRLHRHYKRAAPDATCSTAASCCRGAKGARLQQCSTRTTGRPRCRADGTKNHCVGITVRTKLLHHCILNTPR